MEWLAYRSVEPFGDGWQQTLAIIAALLRKPELMRSLIPHLSEPQPDGGRRQTIQEQMAILKAICPPHPH